MVLKTTLMFSLFIIFSLLSSCAKQVFVVNKPVLDPFTIYSYPSLAMPPLYYLSAQEIADERRFLRRSNQKVQSILLGGLESTYERPINSTASNNLSSGEKALLKLANAEQDFGNIREKIDQETMGTIKKESNFVDSILKNNKGEALDDKLSKYLEQNKK